ncbi:MAG: hypothetical protein AB7G11_15940 [Phycisphaerales bacterium]
MSRRGVGAAALALLVSGVAAEHSCAWHFDYRFVERVGSVDTALTPGVPYNATPGVPTRLRIQFAVFDDAGGSAPAGGFVGWTLGTISDSLGAHNSRTPGRLAPFDVNPNPLRNGSPAGDPFQSITGVEPFIDFQQPIWVNDANGNPLPTPLPTIYGLNAFVSVFELTTTPGNQNYTITAGGSLYAASGWSTVGTPVPPSNNNTPLDPSDDTPGTIVYAPMTLAPQTFVLPPLVLEIHVPAPASAGPIACVCAVMLRRRR